TAEQMVLPAALALPEADGAVGAGGGEQRAVGCEAHVVHGAGVAAALALLSPRNVPHQHLALGGGGELVAREAHPMDPAVRLEAAQEAAVFEIPDAHGAIAPAGDELPARIDGEAGDATGG